MNADRDEVIGAIIAIERELEIRPKKEIETLVDVILDVFFGWLPIRVSELIEKYVPEFRARLIIFVSVMISRYLRLLPGQNLDINTDFLVELGEVLPDEEVKPDLPKDLLDRIDQLEKDLNKSQEKSDEQLARIERLQQNLNNTSERVLLFASRLANWEQLIRDRRASARRKSDGSIAARENIANLDGQIVEMLREKRELFALFPKTKEQF